jgi:hypothetical protein
VSSHVESLENPQPAGSITIAPPPHFWTGHRPNDETPEDMRASVKIWKQVHDHHPHEAVGVGRPCAHGAMRGKAIEISNNLRKMFGFPPIEFHPVQPFRLYEELHPMTHAIPAEKVEHHHMRHLGSIRRLMDAFMALKWWEGGAIAFVFGEFAPVVSDNILNSLQVAVSVFFFVWSGLWPSSPIGLDSEVNQSTMSTKRNMIGKKLSR